MRHRQSLISYRKPDVPGIQVDPGGSIGINADMPIVRQPIARENSSCRV
jgi:hypothetical protein